MGDTYSLATLRKIANPAGIRGVIRHYGTVINQKYQNRFVNRNGCDFINEDWDNLLILDGCRHDLFLSECNINGEINSRQSLGSSSDEFISENFSGRKLHDTVYVSANPYTGNIPDSTFHYVNNILDSAWDKQLGTVHPKQVANATSDAFDRFPQKRIVAHFMQPHYPFIGEQGRSTNTGSIKSDDGFPFGHTIWQQLRYGLTNLSEDEVWELYAENLNVVLEYVEDLLKKLSGTTVITADHGNLVGERLSPVPVRNYGHPSKIQTDVSVTVPWMSISDSRREITAEEPIRSDRISMEQSERRLEALGYR